MLVTIVQDKIKLEIDFDISNDGLAINEILHRGEDIADLLLGPSNADPTMIGIEVKTINAWAEMQESLHKQLLRVPKVRYRLIEEIHRKAREENPNYNRYNI